MQLAQVVEKKLRRKFDTTIDACNKCIEMKPGDDLVFHFEKITKDDLRKMETHIHVERIDGIFVKLRMKELPGLMKVSALCGHPS